MLPTAFACFGLTHLNSILLSYILVGLGILEAALWVIRPLDSHNALHLTGHTGVLSNWVGTDPVSAPQYARSKLQTNMP